MEVSLLKQEIEFLNFQLEDCKSREAQQKNMYEAMIKSLNSSVFHSQNSASDKQVIDDLQKKLEESNNMETLLKSQMEMIQEATSKTIQDLSMQVKNLKLEIKSLENLLIQKDQEIVYFEKNSEKVQVLNEENKKLQEFLDKEKNDSARREERIIEDLEYLHQAKLKNMNQVIENLYQRLAEVPGSALKEVSKLASSISSEKSVQVLKSCDDLRSMTNNLTSSEAKTCFFSLLAFYEELANKNLKNEDPGVKEIPSTKHCRSYTFAPIENSPNSQSKENCPSSELFKQYETIFMFSSTFQCEFCKEMIVKNKFYEHLMLCMNDKTEKYEKLQNDGNGSVFDSFRKIVEKPDLSKIEKMEEQISYLKVSLGKVKNQRDKAKITADKLLTSLKQTKLELAMAEEVAGQKTMELKLEIKNLVNFLLVLRNHLNFPSSFSAEVDKIVENAARLFGGRVGLRL
jgi:hypothetical protein